MSDLLHCVVYSLVVKSHSTRLVNFAQHMEHQVRERAEVRVMNIMNHED
jgi:hypothetical protein